MVERHIILQKTNKGRRIAIGDVHGCAKTLKALVLEQLKPIFDDQIFFLGDYLHRGNDSAGVMDFIFELKAQKYQIFTLSGNHEIMALERHEQAKIKYENRPTDEEEKTKNFENNDKKVPRLIKNANFLDENQMIYRKYKSFLENLPYCYEMEDFIFVHAGINFQDDFPFEDYESMLWERDNDYIPENITAKIIHGHTVTKLRDIIKDIENKNQIIGIDNGCYYGIRPNHFGVLGGFYGNLCALDVDNWKLYTQKCLDQAAVIEDY